MLRLHIQLNGQTVQSIDLNDTQTIFWAGRGENAQIRLEPYEGISRQHFKIFHSGDNWRVEVVSRFHELQVGNTDQRELELQGGVSFRLPPYGFFVEDSGAANIGKENVPYNSPVPFDVKSAQGSSQNPLQSQGLPQTPSFSPSSDSSEQDNDEGEDRTRTQIQEKSFQASLFYKAPDMDEPRLIPLSEGMYLVGRDSSANIPIDDPRFSRKQFQITRVGSRFYIKDFLGVNGTFINKNKITTAEPMELRSGDQIVVLRHKFLFEIRDPEFGDKLQKVQHIANEVPTLPPDELPPEFNPPFMSAPEANSNPVVQTNNGYSNANYGVPAYAAPNFQSGGSGAPYMGPIPTPPPFENGGVAGDGVKTLNFGKFQIPLTKENKFRLGIGVIAFLALVIIASDDTGGFNDDTLVAAAPADPLSKLTEGERAQIKTNYQLANELYEKGSFQLAKDELEKVLAKVPSYENSAELLKELDLKIASLRDREEAEKAQREAQEVDEKIRNIAAVCRQQVQLESTMEQVDDCLKEAIALNPEHEMVLKVRQEVGAIVEKRKREEADRLFREAQIAQLKEAFEKAKAISKKDPLKGVAAYEDLLNLGMPDPDNLKDRAKKEVKRLRGQIKAKVAKAIRGVQKLIQDGKHKIAIIELEKAQIVSPTDPTLQAEIDRVTVELRVKMQVMYQEAILEENLGNRDTAKELWKKILIEDIPNGEYYIKSKMRLTRIGAL